MNVESYGQEAVSVEQSHYTIAKKAASVMLAAACVLPTSYYEGDYVQAPACSTSVSADEFTETVAALEAPDTSDISAILESSLEEDVQATTLTTLVAPDAGVHFADIKNHLSLLKEDAKGGYKKPFDFYLSNAQDYFDDYNIDVTVTDTKSYMGIWGSVVVKDLTPQQQETNLAKRTVVDLLEKAQAIPEEAFAYAGTERIVLGTHTAAIGQWEKGSLFLDAQREGSAGVISHELFHGISEELCGGTLSKMYDKDIVTYNSVPYSENDVQSTKEIVTKTYKELESRVKSKELSSDEVNKRTDMTRANVSYTDAYGSTNPNEDAAQIGRYFGKPWAENQVLDRRSPLLQAKAIIWLARIRERAPKLFEYYNMMMPAIQYGRDRRQ